MVTEFDDSVPPEENAVTTGPDLKCEDGGKVAEREGIEPPRPLRACRFSKPVQSTTLPSLRIE